MVTRAPDLRLNNHIDEIFSKLELYHPQQKHLVIIIAKGINFAKLVLEALRRKKQGLWGGSRK